MEALSATGTSYWDLYNSSESESKKTAVLVDAFVSGLQPLLTSAYESGVDYVQATVNIPKGGPSFPGHDVGLRLQQEGYASVLQASEHSYTVRVNVSENPDAVSSRAKTMAGELFDTLLVNLEGTNRTIIKVVKQAHQPEYVLADDGLLNRLYGKIRVLSSMDRVNDRLRELVADRLPRECGPIDAVYRMSGANVVIVEAMRIHDRFRCCASSAVDANEWEGTEAVTENALFCC